MSFFGLTSSCAILLTLLMPLRVWGAQKPSLPGRSYR